MSAAFDSQLVGVPCPKCSAEITTTVGGLRRDAELACGGCGRVFRLDPMQVLDKLGDAEEQLAGAGPGDWGARLPGRLTCGRLGLTFSIKQPHSDPV